jgi:NADH:ubiquinone oxidoreductase subunit 3 (subunit A)
MLNDFEVEKHLQTMQLPINSVIDLDILKKKYHQLSRIYHPDIAIFLYKDGKLFEKIHESYLFLYQNIEAVNEVITSTKLRSIGSDSKIDEDMKKYEAKLERRHKIIKAIEIIFLVIILFFVIVDILFAFVYAFTLEEIYLDIVLISFIIFAPFILASLFLMVIDNRKKI